MTSRPKWLGPWKLDREKGEWRRKLSTFAQRPFPQGASGGFNTGGMVVTGFVTVPTVREVVVPLKAPGRDR